MKITKEWLEKNNACRDGYRWFANQDKSDHEDVIRSLLQCDHFDWANWVIVRFMNKEQIVKYTCCAARLVLPIYERYKPGDMRPRRAIEAAENGSSAAHAYAHAAHAAHAAAYAAYAADAAAHAAAYAAAYAAYAADAAAHAAHAAAYAADAADAAAHAAKAAAYVAHVARAAYAAADADAKVKTKIIDYGLELISSNK